MTVDVEPPLFFWNPHGLDTRLQLCFRWICVVIVHELLTWLCLQHDMKRIARFLHQHSFSTDSNITSPESRNPSTLFEQSSRSRRNMALATECDATTLLSTTGRNTMLEIGHNKLHCP
jgi:hypothetical protein